MRLPFPTTNIQTRAHIHCIRCKQLIVQYTLSLRSSNSYLVMRSFLSGYDAAEPITKQVAGNSLDNLARPSYVSMDQSIRADTLDIMLPIVRDAASNSTPSLPPKRCCPTAENTPWLNMWRPARANSSQQSRPPLEPNALPTRHATTTQPSPTPTRPSSSTSIIWDQNNSMQNQNGGETT